MAHIIELTTHSSVAELRRALKTSKDEAQKTRIRAIISVEEGATRTETAKRLVISRTTLVSWVAAYNGGGGAALKMTKGGRPEGNPKWDRAIFDALANEIDTKKGYWSVPLMRQWIREHFKKDIPENTVWYHMTNLEYSYKSARPHPAQGNREKHDAFKKGALVNSWSR